MKATLMVTAAAVTTGAASVGVVKLPAVVTVSVDPLVASVLFVMVNTIAPAMMAE